MTSAIEQAIPSKPLDRIVHPHPSLKLFALLDEIHPARIRSAEDWIRREEERALRTGGETLWERVQPETLPKRTILKLSEDHRRGTL